MTKISQHVRSNSFPSAPHPMVSQYEEHIQRLKDSEEATSSSSSISHKLNDLLDLHDFTDKMLQLQTQQQALAQECSDRCIDDLLDGSLRLLDICTTAKDCLMTSKESMHELQSVIRRKRGDETGFTVEAGKYLALRKNLKKGIRKALRNLKATKNDFDGTLSMLKEAEEVTVCSLESLLLFICDIDGQSNSKQSKWWAISKLIKPKRVACESHESDSNEFGKVDAALQSRKPSISIEDLQNEMENLEMCIQDLEIGVDNPTNASRKSQIQINHVNIFGRPLGTMHKHRHPYMTNL